MSMSVSTTGIASGGFDVKLTTTAPLSPLSIEAPVTLGAGDLTLKINGDVSQTSAGGITAAGLQILGTGDRKSVVEGKSVDLGGGRIIKKKSNKDADSLSVGSVTGKAMSMISSRRGHASGGCDLSPAACAPVSPLSIEAPVSLGAGDLTLKINGDVSQTSAGGITAAGLQILGT